MSPTYKKTCWTDYGVLDTTILENKEKAFHDKFEKLANRVQTELRKKIEDIARKKRSAKIHKNINKRRR